MSTRRVRFVTEPGKQDSPSSTPPETPLTGEVTFPQELDGGVIPSGSETVDQPSTADYLDIASPAYPLLFTLVPTVGHLYPASVISSITPSFSHTSLATTDGGMHRQLMEPTYRWDMIDPPAERLEGSSFSESPAFLQVGFTSLCLGVSVPGTSIVWYIVVEGAPHVLVVLKSLRETLRRCATQEEFDEVAGLVAFGEEGVYAASRARCARDIQRLQRRRQDGVQVTAEEVKRLSKVRRLDLLLATQGSVFDGLVATGEETWDVKIRRAH